MILIFKQLARPKMREVDMEMVLRLVAENAKQRFELFYGYDPSPPKPKGKKPKPKPKTLSKPQRPTEISLTHEDDGEGASRDGLEPVTDLSVNLASTSLSPIPSSQPISTDLPLIPLPLPDNTLGPDAGDAAPHLQGEYFIRATQGHSLHLESTDHLMPVMDDEDGRKRVGELVHGTRWELWDTIRQFFSPSTPMFTLSSVDRGNHNLTGRTDAFDRRTWSLKNVEAAYSSRSKSDRDY